MKLAFLILILLSISASVFAQAHLETEEDTTNPNPTIQVPINRNASTTGMAQPPVTRSQPVPPAFSENYRSTPDNSLPTTIPSVPQPGFPGARMPLVNVAPQVDHAGIFSKATSGQMRNCAITELNRRGCQFEVRVDGRVYPFHSPNICSSNDSAAKVGCNHGDERINSACILNQAIMIGYCR